MKNLSEIIIGISIALGLIVLGLFINNGLHSFSNKERVVTVKGLAEQEIKATNASISVNVFFSGDYPKDLVSNISGYSQKVCDYLKKNGYDVFTVGDIKIDDTGTYYEDKWDGNTTIKVKKDRYRGNQNISIVIKDVETAASKANEINLNLIATGLYCKVSCSYTFPELNNIKPRLIEESTKNARIAGEQFANDSKSKLGKIKTASQGQISIAGQYYDEDSSSNLPKEPYMQKVRVVSTIVFFLED